jgi:hypothetical protein
MGFMDYFKGKSGGYPKAFESWVGSNYGPPGKISKKDLEQLYQEWEKKQGKKTSSNALSSGGNALAS